MTIEELSIHQRGLRSRVRRLLEGRAEAADVAHIFAGLRSNAGDHASFREIGDFAAHPDLRNRGPSTNRLKDFMTVFEPLLARASGKELPIERVLDRALANLRMLEDRQLKSRFPFKTRLELEKDLKSAVFKMKNKFIGLLTPAEQQLLIDFGDRAIWNPAFRDREVFSDFIAVLTNSGLVQTEEMPALEGSRNLVIMYVISTFHGARMSLGGGKFCDLQAGYDNRYGDLEITAEILVSATPKPTSMKVGLFWTEMPGSEFCDPALGKGPWDGLIGMDSGKLVPID